jgi:hypothetical protein
METYKALFQNMLKLQKVPFIAPVPAAGPTMTKPEFLASVAKKQRNN